MLKNEGALQEKCLKWLHGNAGGKWENRAPGPFGSSGVPDICGSFQGRAVYIELKNPNHHGPPPASDRRWPGQRKFLSDAYKSGRALCLGTNDFEMVRSLIVYINSDLSDYGISLVQPVFWERFI